MRRLVTLALLALPGLAVSARAGECLGCKTRCRDLPESECRERGCPCDKRLNMALFDKADKYIEVLEDCEAACCARIKAARKLGNRLKADICADKGVLDALLNALFYDSCWRVRDAAAWSLFGQRAYQDDVILALYISARLDPHALVRARAAEALDLLTLCHRCCYKELYATADEIIKDMRKQKFVPGRPDAREKHAMVGMAGSTSAGEMRAPAEPRPNQPRGTEVLPSPGPRGTEVLPSPGPGRRVMPPAAPERIPSPMPGLPPPPPF